MAIISLSLSSFINDNMSPNNTINGNVIFIKLGIKKDDKNTILLNSTCKLFIIENNLEIWSNHAIETKIKKTSVQDLIIWINM